MKKLIMLRHGKSAWPSNAVSDHERPLKSRGEQDAKLIGKWLNDNRENEPEIIYSSSAKRAIETITIVRSCISMSISFHIRSDLYSFSSFEVLAKIYEYENRYNEIMMVGHNPAYTELYRYLTGKELDNLPTCGLMILNFDSNDWNKINSGNMVRAQIITPKELK